MKKDTIINIFVYLFAVVVYFVTCIFILFCIRNYTLFNFGSLNGVYLVISFIIWIHTIYLFVPYIKKKIKD